MYKSISKKELIHQVKKDSLTIIKFKKEWNGACQILEPLYSDLSKKYASQAGFFTVDVDKENGLKKEYGIMEVPTILLFRKGQIIDHVVGLTSKKTLIEKIEHALNNY